MKIIQQIILALVVSFSATSYADSGERLEAAKDLLDVMRTDSTLQKTIEQLLEVQLKQKPELRPFEKVLFEFLNKHMSYDNIKDDLAKLWADTFTKKEIFDLIEFYKTPTGQKTIDLLPVLSAKGAQIGYAKIQKHQSEFEEMIMKEAKRIQQQQNQ